MYLLYSLAFGGLVALALPYFLYRSLRERGYSKGLFARFRVPRIAPSDKPLVWVHAVSVGEVKVAATLLPALRRELPDARFVVSVITATGRQVAEDTLRDVDAVFSCPFDLAFLVRRVVRALQPSALVVVETEIWPHLLREAKRAGAAIVIAGGRISDRSFPRYRAARGFMRRFLEPVDRYCMQNALYAERIVAVGAASDRVEVTGNVKFDAVLDGVEDRPRVFPEDRLVLVAGSTLDPEEESLLTVFEGLRAIAPKLFLVLAPRHPHRFDEAFALSTKRGFSTVRRTDGGAVPADADVLILDTLGELASLYQEADYVFVGGSLSDWGGHNIIEPASQGKPVFFGPYMRNFADIARTFVTAKAAVQVQDRKELESRLRDVITHPERGVELSENALGVVADNRGASSRTAKTLAGLLR